MLENCPIELLIEFDRKEDEIYIQKNVFSIVDGFIARIGRPNFKSDFIGHAIALYTSDNFLEEKAINTVEKMQLYFNSFGRYGDSPFIYPVYGLSGLAEAFSRLCALYFNPSSIF